MYKFYKYHFLNIVVSNKNGIQFYIKYTFNQKIFLDNLYLNKIIYSLLKVSMIFITC